MVLHPAVRGGGRSDVPDPATGADGPGRQQAASRPPAPERPPEARLAEAVGLAHAIELDVVESRIVKLHRRRPGTLLGEGTVQELKGLIEHREIGLVVIDAALTPVQQRNLEKSWACKVIDRTGLILEIFGARARTKEGQLQVELAALSYQRSRLVRSWTHLERQRGGRGFLAGPGESQLEIDRRLIDERMIRLKKELETVVRTRGLHRKARQRVPFPVVALVGYTNAGKSTLFNRLTTAEVLAKDMLFATLDPTMRGVALGGGRRMILSDTVGFISDLPHQLVAAFRATLEEVREADIVLHVRDMSDPHAAAQRSDVESVLRSLEIDLASVTMIEVMNKIDLLAPGERHSVEALAARTPDAVAVSAVDGTGIAQLLAMIEAKLAATMVEVEIEVPLADGATMAWLYQHGRVIARTDGETCARMVVGLSPADQARFARRLSGQPAC
ncbi:MAG: GTPase HflX [Alphaproteobacteria bacterium]|nr:GTPase HflX [Alphaproteobacteria bacterium]